MSKNLEKRKDQADMNDFLRMVGFVAVNFSDKNWDELEEILKNTGEKTCGVEDYKQLFEPFDKARRPSTLMNAYCRRILVGNMYYYSIDDLESLFSLLSIKDFEGRKRIRNKGKEKERLLIKASILAAYDSENKDADDE